MRLLKPIIAAAISALIAGFVAADATNYFSELGQLHSNQALTLISDQETSAANTALTLVYDSQDIHNSISVMAVCSAGTAALTVSVAVDGVTWTAIDSVSAAATTAKVYGTTTAGATVAVSPLSFRYIKFSKAACGSGDTSTMTVSGK